MQPSASAVASKTQHAAIALWRDARVFGLAHAVIRQVSHQPLFLNIRLVPESALDGFRV
jgi:hypothetical protein